MKHVMCLAGGGVRGRLQIQILKELYLQSKLQDVDLIVGSSVGAVNGSLISVGKLSIPEICDIYPEVLKKIFKRRSFLPFLPKYDRKNFINVWNDLVGMVKMSEVKIPLVISSLDFTEKRMHFFKSYKEDDKEEYVLTNVLRSFAAPVYFSLIDDIKNRRVWGDGGCGNDNLPVFEGLFEAISQGWIEEGVKFTIVGTGFSNIAESYETVSAQTNISEAFDFISPKDGGIARLMSRQRQIDSLAFIADKMNIKFDYYDIQIPKKLDAMDNLKDGEEYDRLGLEASKKPLVSV